MKYIMLKGTKCGVCGGIWSMQWDDGFEIDEMKVEMNISNNVI